MRFAVLLLLVAAPLAAAPKNPSRRPAAAGDSRVVWGKVTRIEGNRVEVKPWRPNLPKRMWITVGPETRLLLQKKFGLDAAKAGERVTVLGSDTPPIPRPVNPADAAKPPEPPRPPRPPRASAIFVYPDTEAPPDERKIYYRSARGFFIGARKGGVDRPGRDAPIIPGTLVSTRPLVVKDAKGDHPFHARDSLFVVRHVPTRIEDLDKGESITAHCRVADITSQGDLVADLVVVGPDPLVGKKAQRQLILREQRPLRAEKTPANPDASDDLDEDLNGENENDKDF